MLIYSMFSFGPREVLTQSDFSLTLCVQNVSQSGKQRIADDLVEKLIQVVSFAHFSSREAETGVINGSVPSGGHAGRLAPPTLCWPVCENRFGLSQLIVPSVTPRCLLCFGQLALAFFVLVRSTPLLGFGAT